ncbi:MAG TPA: hypothetical protein VM166_05735 [Gemmatimonadaceae bacterium]|nr:hypothetical protein [Gemmatimonadaceae bacterium]
MRIRSRFNCIVVLFCVLAGSRAGAQPLRALPCPSEQNAAFAFLVGDWNGVVYELKGSDSTASGVRARVSAAKVLNGCALVEQWHFLDKDGQPEIDGVILRAFSAATGKWSYNLATNRNEHVTYQGDLIDGKWSFFYEFPGPTPAKVRITWVPAPDGYSEQIARSTDGGATWVSTRHINFTRAKP